jgi:DNA-binding LacI/PurR family transcriptional regulator
MKKKSALVTQKQIARDAGVSQTTVSLILNNSPDVVIADATRQRVLAVAESLGYVPQSAAQTLVRGHSLNLGLVLIKPHDQVFRDPYIPSVMTGFSRAARPHGFRMLVEHVEDIEDADVIRRMVKGGEVAGLVITNFHKVEPIIESLVDEDYPVVLLEQPNLPRFYSASIAHYDGIRTIISYLIGLGHRHIACIPYGPTDDHHISRRLAAFRQTLEDAGLDYDPGLVRAGQYEPESGYEAMRTLLDSSPRPTAVFGMNDMMAIGAMRAIHERGLHIPGDIAVVGYDDMRFAAYTTPPLTTVRAPEIELGRRACELLIELVEGRRPAVRQIKLATEMIIRSSSEPIP